MALPPALTLIRVTSEVLVDGARLGDRFVASVGAPDGPGWLAAGELFGSTPRYSPHICRWCASSSRTGGSVGWPTPASPRGVRPIGVPPGDGHCAACSPATSTPSPTRSPGTPGSAIGYCRRGGQRDGERAAAAVLARAGPRPLPARGPCAAGGGTRAGRAGHRGGGAEHGRAVDVHRPQLLLPGLPHDGQPGPRAAVLLHTCPVLPAAGTQELFAKATATYAAKVPRR